MKIYLLEDDKKLNYSICEYLTCKDLKVVSSNSSEFLNEKDIHEFDLFIISAELEEKSGLDILNFIKSKSPEKKVIIITANDSISQLEKAFYYNSDEYLKKPFHLKELELRIYRIMGVSHVINIHNDLIYNMKTSNLYHKDKVINLRKKEKVLLNILVTNRGKVVSKEAIIDHVWKDIEFEEYPIRQLVSNLREKLPTDIIETKVGKGYKIS